MNTYYKDKQWLEKQYLELRKSIPEIAKEYNFSKSNIRKYIQLNGIKIRDRRECQIGRKITWKNKISLARKRLFKEGKIKPHFLGRKHTEYTKQKIANSRIGRKFPKLSAIKKIQNAGSGNPNYGKYGKEASGYKGDRCVSPLRERVRQSHKYSQWRKMVFIRDNYICRECNKRGGDMEVHHIISFSTLMKGITSFEEAIQKEELWCINNGITLCKNCHRKTFVYQGNQYDRKEGEFRETPTGTILSQAE